MMKRSKRSLLGLFLGGIIAASGFALTSPSVVQAQQYPSELLLGSFWESDSNTTDTLYWSTDGINFYELAEAYVDATPDTPNVDWIQGNDKVSTLHDPSIIYKDGYFWMLSGFSQTNSAGQRRYIPMMGYSKNLTHWSYPGSGSQVNVGVTQAPPGADKYGTAWDAVAPEFFVDDNGTVWITVCMGYYANFHGDSSANDVMKPYLIQVTGLTPGGDPANNPDTQPQVTYSDAVPVNLPKYNTDVHNRIDSSIFKEGGYYYFCVKKDGVTNEIWRTRTLTLDSVQQESNWELVCDDAVTGFEGPSLTKYSGTYYLYTDKLKDYPPDNHDGKAGVHVNIASTATTGQMDKYTGWLEGNQFKIRAHAAKGGLKETRHGTVITLTDPNAIKTVWDLKAKTVYAPLTGHEETPALVSSGWYQKESFKGPAYGGTEVCYWYDNNVRQGLTDRGKEIYDPATDGWYWMDSLEDGKMAVNKDVYQPYTVQGQDGTGKWVRYDQFGRMQKGQVHAPINGSNEWGYWWFDETTGAMKKGLTEVNQVRSREVPLTDRHGNVMKDSNGNTAMKTEWYMVDGNNNEVTNPNDAAKKWVYYDDNTGIMLKGYHTIGDTLYYFDEHDGTAIDGWRTDSDGKQYWYEKGARQGYDTDDPNYRGKEIYDPYTDAWYWLDNVQDGGIAKNKDVYQESYAGPFADREDGTGKWVRYDNWGKMVKGWDWGALDNQGISQYFDPVTGAMAKGDVWIGDEHWFFDWQTGQGRRLN